MLTRITLIAVVTASISCGEVVAQTCPSYPSQLMNGQTADANQVMGNFNQILNCANNNLAPLANPHFTGSVGVGTTNPGAALDINGTGNFSGVLSIPGGASNLPGFHFSTVGSADSYGINIGIALDTQYNLVAAVSNLGFRVVNSDGNVPFSVASSGNVGIGTTTPSYALTVNGTAYASGAAGALSDARDKEAIQYLPEGALDIVMKLRPASFRWKKPVDDGMRGEQMGFVAQDVEKIIPSLVLIQKDDRKTEALKYNEFIPILTKAIQEQQAEIEDLRAQLAKIVSRSN